MLFRSVPLASTTPVIAHSLLVSCPNGGGLLSVCDDRVAILDHHATTGLHATPELVVRGRQTVGNTCLDLFQGGELRSLVVGEVCDIHDVLYHDNLLHVVSTGTNAVLAFDLAGRLVRRAEFPGAGDSWHLNCLALLPGGLAVSAFGEFSETRGWDGRTDGRGLIVPVEGGFPCRPILDGLDQPHSPVWHNGILYCCDSRSRSLVRVRAGHRDSLVLGDRYPRGLAVCGDTAYVGLSNTRNLATPPTATTAAIAVVDLTTFRARAVIRLPFQEVYQIVTVTRTQLADVARACAANGPFPPPAADTPA